MSGISRSGTRRSGAPSGTEKILREPAIGPVVTFGVARSESESGLFIGSLLSSDPDAGACWGGICEKFPSLRRHDPDQVQRVFLSP